MSFIPFTFKDFIDILLVATILFWIYRSTKGTNAPYIFVGVVAFYILWIVVRGFNMELLSNILGQFISVGAIALIVIFQPEIRRFLQLLRFRKPHFKFLDRIFASKNTSNHKNLSVIVDAISELSQRAVGVVVVLSQHSDLSLIIDGGTTIDARLSRELIVTLLGGDSVLNRGALVIDGGRIVAARCILPLSHSDLSGNLSIRQKAALGLSEISDAVIVTVDAFDSSISVVNSGVIHQGVAIDELLNILREHVDIYMEG